MLDADGVVCSTESGVRQDVFLLSCYRSSKQIDQPTVRDAGHAPSVEAARHDRKLACSRDSVLGDMAGNGGWKQ